MIRLVCRLCADRTVRAWDAINTHVETHHLIGDAVQMWWATSNGLVLKPAAPPITR